MPAIWKFGRLKEKVQIWRASLGYKRNRRDRGEL